MTGNLNVLIDYSYLGAKIQNFGEASAEKAVFFSLHARCQMSDSPQPQCLLRKRRFLGVRASCHFSTVLTNPSPVCAKYWSELKDLSDNVKLELITLLSSSMTHPENEDKDDAGKGWTEKFAGKWQDDRTAEEIVEDIRAARNAHMRGIVL